MTVREILNITRSSVVVYPQEKPLGGCKYLCLTYRDWSGTDHTLKRNFEKFRKIRHKKLRTKNILLEADYKLSNDTFTFEELLNMEVSRIDKSINSIEVYIKNVRVEKVF